MNWLEKTHNIRKSLSNKAIRLRKLEYAATLLGLHTLSEELGGLSAELQQDEEQLANVIKQKTTEDPHVAQQVTGSVLTSMLKERE